MTAYVNVTIDGHVGLLRLNRPEARNALSPEVMEEIAAELERLDPLEEVRCIVLAGSEEVFAAGADIKAMSERTFAESHYHPAAAFWRRLAGLRTPLVAAVSGWALGGGCELALACDLRYASSDAQIGQPEILIGVIPGAGGTQRMPRLVGAARAKDLILSGRQLDAAEAERIGLVTRVFDSEDVLDAAIQDARGYARGPAVALATAKDAIRAAENGLRSGLDAEREAFCALFGTRDQKEGMAAFLEKRPPEFDGR